MNKKLLGIIIAVLAIVGIGAVVISSNKDDTTPSTTRTQPTASNRGTTEQTNSSTENAAEQTESTGQQTSSVEISNFSFSPSKITIKKGTTVTWTNKDSQKHDVVPDNPSDSFKGSELLDKGQSYSFTFNTAGTYNYHCTPHPFMKGTVEVTE